MTLIIIVIVLILLFGGGGWAYPRYGYQGLGGLLGFILILLLVMWFLGALPVSHY